MLYYKNGTSNVRYQLKYTAKQEGILWWRTTVFKWQVVKLYWQHYEEVDEIYWCSEDVFYEKQTVLAEFNEDDKEGALTLLGKYNKSLENNLT